MPSSARMKALPLPFGKAPPIKYGASTTPDLPRQAPPGGIVPGQKGNSMKPLEPYDIEKLKEAQKIIEKVHGYYFCAPGFLPIQKRLETILRKLDELLTLYQ